MQKMISTKDLYFNFKKISDDVQKGVIFIVLKYSKPVYKIVPINTNDFGELDNNSQDLSKYSISDINKFVFKSKNKKEKNLSTKYKKYIY